ncbi:MAG: indolepyruvate ferredoxin oxidoreductase family protein [Acetobacteraceae bacterium]
MDIGLAPDAITLDSRYTDFDRPVLLSGVQALVRALLEQARLDAASGLRTAGLVSGYRGSPLGGVDRELWRQEPRLTAAGVRFQPGLNEDLAATMLWGSQQIDTFPGKTVDGVFGMWYGKGPGVDRSGDAFRCANTLGTAPLGGVLAVSGDDHAAHSSVFPHQTDGIFQSVNIPILQPADVAEILDFSLAGIALSRFSGLWVALKTIAETAEQHGLATVPRTRAFRTPELALPPHGLNLDHHLSWPAQRQELERRVLQERLPAARAWARVNGLDRLERGDAQAEIGIVTVGKAHWDLVHALRRLGLERHPAIAVYKVGLIWPLETEGVRAFATGKRALLVVEEKRSFVEMQLRDALYNMPEAARPWVEGKLDRDGRELVPAAFELSPELVLPAVQRMLRAAGLEVPEVAVPALPLPAGTIVRAPMFCAGCPHNKSTTLPEGSHAMAGIGCHTMAVTTNDFTRTFSQMGGEGVPWVGLEHFTDLPHMFANMGDGTYQHSGVLAIRQAVAAGSHLTYKLLFNDAVAMTGGQPAEGAPTVPGLAAQLAAEGVGLIAVVADDAARLPSPAALPPGTLRHGRAELDAVQRRMREHQGVSAIIYDQVCATETRRRRKRGKIAAAQTRVLINTEVCENCGDCTVQSNCIAIEPVETDHGRKRRISPTSCNTDLSCLKGFCPSFVTSSAAAPPPVMDHAGFWAEREAGLAADLPAPAPVAAATWRGLFAGIGGGGIVTAGGIVAMAAHLEGRQVSTLDFTGLAQKNGAVVSHVQVGDGELDVVRVPHGAADLLLAADLAVGADPEVLGRCRGDAAVIGNLDLQAGAGFLRDRDLVVDAGLHRRVIERATDAGQSSYLHGSAVSERLFGTAQAVNTLMLGIAWQRGRLPVGEAALLRSIELNGTAVALNRRAFLWGRILAGRPELADAILADLRALPPELPALVERRAAELVSYQSTRLARRYRKLVEAASARETALAGAPGAFTRAVAEGWFRALAYKDEYEVARLHAAAEYGEAPVFHLAPPLLTRVDPATGRRRKLALPGRVALPLFRAMRHGRVLRGTPLDPFGWQADRRQERRLIAQYEADLRRVLPSLRPDTLAAAAELAGLPLGIRGFGPVKAASLAAAEPRRAALLERIETPQMTNSAAAE